MLYLPKNDKTPMKAQEVTERISQAMKARKITQAELAARLNVSQNQIRQYLTGAPRLDSFLKIAAALDLEAADLLKEEATTPPAVTVCPFCGQPLKIIIK